MSLIQSAPCVAARITTRQHRSVFSSIRNYCVSNGKKKKKVQIYASNSKISLCIVAAKTEIMHKLKQLCSLKLWAVTLLAMWWHFRLFHSMWGYIIELFSSYEHYVSVHMGLQVSIHQTSTTQQQELFWTGRALQECCVWRTVFRNVFIFRTCLLQLSM